MKVWKRRVINTVVAVTLLIVASSLIYHYIMLYVEGLDPELADLHPVSQYLHSLQVVVETYTGTGYGSDSGWESPVANLFVSAMDLATFLLLFIILPYVFRPMLDAVMSPDVPGTTDLTEHTLICDYTERTEKLVEELQSRDADYLVLHDDEDVAVELIEQGVEVVGGSPSSTEDLRSANLEDAASVVVDTEDRESASVVLAVREVSPEVPVTVLVRDLSLEKYLMYAGASSVLTPRRLLGRRIAERIAAEIDPGVTDSSRLAGEYVVSEVTVMEDSPVIGSELGRMEVLQDTETKVPAMWREGGFVASPPPDTVVESHDQLIVVGPEDEVAEIEEHLHPGLETGARIVVAGFGEVGSTVSENLRVHGKECTVLDMEDLEGVDLVGDATDEDVLREAGLEEATVFVSTVQDDDEAILSVLVARELADDVEIIARVNDSENQNKIRRAGADYVLSLPDISGRILAAELLEEDVFSLDRQVRVIDVEASNFGGQEYGQLGIDEGESVVVAVERDDEVFVDVGPEFVFEEGDVVYFAGEDEALEEVEQMGADDED